MTDIQTMANRLAELERARGNIDRYNHPDDANASHALGLRYLFGTVHHEAALCDIRLGLDEMIAKAKRELREALE